MNHRLRKGIFLAALFLSSAAVCFPGHLFAQELSAVKGGLGGVVTDLSGAVVPDAKVTVTGAADQRVVTTDGAGRFTATNLTPGHYTVTVEKAGFKTASAKNLEVVINHVSGVNLALQPGAVSETVEVDATTVSIDTNSTAIGNNLNATFYSQVPVARNVGSLFYTAPGVADGGGTGNSNPSIGGSTGLENQYVADGVNINDAGYGGIGVYSPNYGSLGTGINLSFIEEVQVKTGAFEPKYGKANGGVVQIVTKSGGSQYHGALSAFVAPEAFSAGFKYADNQRLAVAPNFVQGTIYSFPAYDAAAEFGGYIPVKGHHDKLFFFGAFNPALTQVYWLAPNTAFAANLFNHGPYATSITAYNWAGKLTYKLSDATSLEASAFGDPSKTNFGYANSFTQYNEYPNLNFRNTTGFSRWDYGSRSVVARLNSSVTPTLQVNLSASAKTSHFTESGFPNIYQVGDRTPGFKRGFQGLGHLQNPKTNDYGFSIDVQKVVPFFGSHTFSLGWGFDRTIYNVFNDYTGPHFNFPATNAAGTPIAAIGGTSALVGANTNAAFYLASAKTQAANGCPASLCPTYSPLGGNPLPVYLRQVRGVFSSAHESSSGAYHAIYGNDDWAVTRRITFNLGIRWEEEQINGPNQQFVFVDNWSPRLGINIDPFGDRKNKLFFNYGRYTQSLPYDAAIRELNQELDVTARWAAPANPDGTLKTNADGTITPVLDAAHLLSKVYGFAGITANPSTPELFSPGTKLNYEEEYVAGLEHQFANGIVVSARYTDRRLKRIVEDMGGASPEGANAGVPQVFVIGNPSPTADYFVNEQEVTYTGSTPPASCNLDYGPQQDSLGNDLGSACGKNYFVDSNGNPLPNGAGYPAADGKPDGFVNPVRHYQALEIEVNKNFSHNFLLRANYRFAKLYGNYEGLFRNDNQQSDPGISSLFDFTAGLLGLLGSQFDPGYLNTDRRNVGNVYGSYVVPSGFLKKLTAGIGIRGQSGTPLNKLLSHPVYANVGEVPYGGRGTAGRLPSTIQVDLHGDYPVPVGEKSKLKLAFDIFNVANSQHIVNKNQYLDTGFQQGADPSFGTPTQFQRALYARGSVRWEF